MSAVKEAARDEVEITSDDVWARLATGSPPHEPRAMGAVMREAQARGWIESTERMVPSERRGCHKRPIRVWKSLLVRDH